MRGTASYGLCYEGRLGLDRVVDIHGSVDVDWAGDLQEGMCLTCLEEQ